MSPFRVIDEMPDRRAVQAADDYQLVCWHLFLRPTMNNDELDIVKAIAARYERLTVGARVDRAARAWREYGR